MQAEWKEFIHKSLDPLCLKESLVLSSCYTGELGGGILQGAHTQRKTVQKL